MKAKWTIIFAAMLLGVASFAYSQDMKSDVDKAADKTADATKDAAKDTAHATKKAAKKAPTVVEWPDGKLSNAARPENGVKESTPRSWKCSGRARPIVRFRRFASRPEKTTVVNR